MASYERTRLLRSVGVTSALLGVLAAILIVDRNYEDRRALAEQVRERNISAMRAAKEHIEDHMRSIWLCMKLISLDPSIASMSPGPYDNVEAVHKATYALHGLTEIYVVERDFDGKRHPFLSLFREEDGQLVNAGHALERELEEYAVHVEQIARFAEDRSLEFLVTGPIQLCVGRPGVVCAVPLRPEGRFVGIIAGMVRSEEISSLLEVSSTGDELILANGNVGFFPSLDASQKTRTWFQERFDLYGVDGFFEHTKPTFRVGSSQGLWDLVDMPGEEKWYIAYVYDDKRYLHASAVQSSWATWASASAAVALGLLVMFLCRLVPALAVTRMQANARADALAESEARTRAVLDTAADGIVTIDERGVIESFNAAAEQIFGYTGGEVIGKYVNILMPSPHREYHDNYLQRYLQGGEPRIIGAGREVEGRHKDGRVLPLELDVSEVHLADRRLFTGLVRDITERKRSEQALRESEDRYRTLVHNIELGVTLVDADYNIVMANEAHGRLFNKPVGELVGRKCYLEFEKSRAVCSHCPGTQAMATGKPAQVETEGVRDDGSRFIAHIRAFPVPGADGKATGFIEVVEDVTERRQSEEQTRERQAELAHVARLGTIGEMATGIAHELNQPLSAIVNYIQACLENIRAGRIDSPELLDDMAQAAGQAVRAGDIIERLRNFAGHPSPHWSTVDVNVLVREVVDMIWTELKHCGVETHLELEDSLPLVEADAIQIQQVLVNLIKNGMEAMVSDGTDKRQLTVVTSRNRGDELIECAVLDTGPGLRDDAADRVFEPFFTTKADGMGMGLSISRKIIEAHGGRLWATPAKDGGAAFRFALPIGHGRSVA